MEGRILGTENTTEEIDTLVKENVKTKDFLTQNIKKIWDTMRKPNLRITGMEEREELQFKGT